MGKIKVLLVDDDVIFGGLITQTLEELGYDVYYQSSLSAINEVICDINPNVIILDVEVGHKNSIESISEIKTATEDIPIIFISSHTDGLIAAKAIQLGGATYLRKPFRNEELIAYINKFACTNTSSNLIFGKYTLESGERSLLHNGLLVRKLSSKEYRMLKLLVLNINTVVGRNIIISKVWDQEVASGHSITNFITKLRTYLSEDKEIELVTILNIGYKLISKSESIP